MVLASFAVLFTAYQLPEGVGIHLLHRPAVQAALLLLFYPVAYGVARALGYSGFQAYALGLPPGWERALGRTLPIALAAKALAVVVGLWAGVYARQPAGREWAGALAALAGIAFTTLFPSVAEDIVTRGFWYRQLPALGRGVGFVLFSAALYLLNHVYRLGNGPAEWLMLFVFGIAYAAALARSGTLWAAVGLHWGWNIAAFAADSVFGVSTRIPWAGPLLSAAAHLAMLAVVCALPWPPRTEPSGAGLTRPG